PATGKPSAAGTSRRPVALPLPSTRITWNRDRAPSGTCRTLRTGMPRILASGWVGYPLAAEVSCLLQGKRDRMSSIYADRSARGDWRGKSAMQDDVPADQRQDCVGCGLAHPDTADRAPGGSAPHRAQPLAYRSHQLPAVLRRERLRQDRSADRSPRLAADALRDQEVPLQ